MPSTQSNSAPRSNGRLPRRRALEAALLIAAIWTLPASTRAAGGSSFSVATSASPTGSAVSGILNVANQESEPITLVTLTVSLEVRFDEGAAIPPLPAGSDSGWYRVALKTLPTPVTLSTGGSQGFPFVIDPCDTSTPAYRNAKDMRAVGTAAAGRVRDGYSEAFPLPAACPVCGNFVVEAGEQCDAGANGGSCCSSVCSFRPTGTTCNDGNACTQTDQCQVGICVGSAPIVCTATDACRVAGTCDPATGICSQPAKPNGSACDDQNACTQLDGCQSGVCRGANPVVCPASGACMTSTCNPVNGQCTSAPKPDGTACVDASACTEGDRCIGGTCSPGEPLVCNDSMSCTVDACNPASGCGFSPAPSCEACDAAQCTDCGVGCEVAHDQCETGCWSGFTSCLAGCTSTYCAPFCQVDLGRCLSSCPTTTTCRSACEAGNGCGEGCTGVAAASSSSPQVPSFTRAGLIALTALLALIGNTVATNRLGRRSGRDPRGS